LAAQHFICLAVCRPFTLFTFQEFNMTATTTKSVASFAMTAALLAISAASFAADAPKGSSGAAIGANDKVHCYNVHDCKGNSDCKTAEHSCKGQNGCKGHGFKAKTAGACLKENGTIGDIKG
jgi:hypothetical protein